VAGTNAAGGKHRFGAITGTTAIRVFDYILAKSGLNEREAVKAGFDPVSSYLPDYDRDPFIQDARMINIKMTADRVSHKILGVQIVDEGEVAKRIDVAAAVIVKAGTLSDIIALDLGYTPAYSQAIYEAALILKANGFKTMRILEGGLRMWPFKMARE